MKDFDDKTRRAGEARLADTRTGHPATADAAADPIHGVEPRTGSPASADARDAGALGRPSDDAGFAGHDASDASGALDGPPAHDEPSGEEARRALSGHRTPADDAAPGEMTAPEARHAAALPGGQPAHDPEAERIERLREARGEADAATGADAGPGVSRAEARARLLTTALPFGWKGMLGFGILTALGGAAAILMPFVGTLATVGFAAAMFILLGAGTVFMAIRGDERVVPHRVMNGALGALMIAFGVLAFFNPLGAILSLTILAASFFVAEGAMRIWLGARSRERKGWVWLVLGGALSVVLGLMLFLGLPGTALWALGLILGIDLLATGIAMIALSFAEKRATGGVDEGSPA